MSYSSHYIIFISWRESMEKILVIEDELSIVKLLRYNLEKENYTVVAAMDGEEGHQLALNNEYSIILLDLMLPSRDGIEIAKNLRNEKIEVPIIMLTAKDSEIDKVVGLEIGADDYVTKPFSPRELIARIKVILKRSKRQYETLPHEKNERLELADIVIYPTQFEVFVEERKVNLTPKEFDLLLYLVEHKNRILSREQLLAAIWDYDYDAGTRIVDVHISHLREKIEINPKEPVYIKTSRGFGYKFEIVQ